MNGKAAGVSLLAKLLVIGCLAQCSYVRAATLTVCDEASLRAAVVSGGVITFGCDGVISISQTITNNTDVTLDSGGHAVTLSGGSLSRIFYNTAGHALTLVGLTVSDGVSPSGGAIHNEGNLAIARCLFRNNRAVGVVGSLPAIGGAIFSRGNLSVESSRFENNQANSPAPAALGENGLDANAGAIASLGAISLTNTVFVANSCAAASGANVTPEGRVGNAGIACGGAIWSSNSFAATSCVFSNNIAHGGNGGKLGAVASFASSGRAGGGAFGSAVYVGSGIASLQRSEIADNALIGGAAGESTLGGAVGGAVYLASGVLNASQDSWIHNTAVSGAGGDAPRSGINSPAAAGWARGGGVYIEAGEFNGTNTTFFGNSVTGGAGGVGVSTAPPPTGVGGPGGEALGAGVAIQTGTARLIHSAFVLNEAIPGMGGSFGGSSPGASGDRGRGHGAGVDNIQGAVLIGNSLLVSNRVTMAGHPVTPFFFENIFGAIQDAGFNISSDNTAPFAMSAVDAKLGPLDYFGGSTRVFSLLAGSPAIDFSNRALSPSTDQRGVSRQAGRSPDAGPFEFQQPAIAQDDNGALDALVAAGGRISFSRPVSFYRDQPLEIVKDTILDGSSFPIVLDGRNSVRLLHVHSGINLALFNVTVANGAGPDGGGLWNDNGVVTILNGKFVNNRAFGTNGMRGLYSAPRSKSGAAGTIGRDARGGAIFNTGTLTVSNVVFSSNSALGGGGGDGGLGGDAVNYLLMGGPCRSISGVGGGGAGGSGGAGVGGAIWNSGSAFFVSCGFQSNSVHGGQGGEGAVSGAPGCFPSAPDDQGSGSGGRGGSGLAGAIYNSGTLVMTNSSVTRGIARGAIGGAGGAAVRSGSFSSYVGGSGGDGGVARGGAMWNAGSLFLTNVTLGVNAAGGGNGGSAGDPVSNSSACKVGGNGGNAEGGGLFDAAAAQLVQCTIADCNVTPGAFGPSPVGCAQPSNGIASGALIVGSVAPGPTLFGTILSNTTGANGVPGNFTDAGFNISSDNVNFKSPSSQSNLDPGLLPLRTDSSTAYYPLSANSPAIDRVPSTRGAGTDQRGAARPAGSASDVGAVERIISDASPQITLTSSSTLSITYQAAAGVDYVLFDALTPFVWSPFRTNRADASGTVLFDSLNRNLAPVRYFQARELNK